MQVIVTDCVNDKTRTREAGWPGRRRAALGRKWGVV